jgi:hypothetical protein
MDTGEHMDKWLGIPKDGKVNTSTAQILAMLYDFQTELHKEVLTKQITSLREFQKKYPAVTSADFQTFLIGYQSALDNLNIKP